MLNSSRLKNYSKVQNNILVLQIQLKLFERQRQKPRRARPPTRAILPAKTTPNRIGPAALVFRSNIPAISTFAGLASSLEPHAPFPLQQPLMTLIESSFVRILIYPND
ncbi:MAG: hypothetical protein IPN81_01890 [Nitrosomonadales bacterium]|nr:hypothetical protein [Nitrosomonadales bacterium]